MPHFLGKNLHITTLGYMTIIDTKGRSYKYPYHKKILFTFPNVGHITTVDKRNWPCDGVLVTENAMGQEDEGDSDYDDRHKRNGVEHDGNEEYEGDNIPREDALL